MSVAKKAEELVKEYFKEIRGVDMVKPKRGERGFDFRNKDSTIFIEVKGSSARRLTEIMFLMFTNSEYERAKDCLRQSKTYEVHLVTGVGTGSIKHYLIPGEVFVNGAKPEIAWILPTSKKIIQDEFLVRKDTGKT
ncbi:MAG: protein NO VEIN domain-containing protein [Candidatus Hodarchaeales archaeon]